MGSENELTFLASKDDLFAFLACLRDAPEELRSEQKILEQVGATKQELNRLWYAINDGVEGATTSDGRSDPENARAKDPENAHGGITIRHAGNDTFQVVASRAVLDVVRRCIRVTLEQMEYWEFHTRVGRYPEEARAVERRLTEALE